MTLLKTLIRIGLFHGPTLDYIVTSPIAMAFSSCLSFVEDSKSLNLTIFILQHSFREWNDESAEVAQSGKRMLQALFSEGLEDTLEQTLMHEKSEDIGVEVASRCVSFSQLLGSNVKKLR
ncbi:hypothetical protein BLNAU_13827 [Blattamonas nauphoetae]|uniref:Uncharacterized protein n=1 Tax=Blattamonas nauphoetae TaxID=2049346 RepID=A0ABQ9XGT9_9EUKA|nr:hypothetical protein BLNAU_13827 [Blattamonas nauphoetae]